MDDKPSKAMRDARKDTDTGLATRAKAGDKEALNRLVRNHKDLIQMKARGFRNAPIPLAAIEGEGIRLLAVAVTKFDPDQGVAFRTFLDNYLRGLYRYVNGNKRVDRAPEHRHLRYHRFDAVRSLLQVEHNRVPTTTELSDALGWSPADVRQMEQMSSQRSLAGSGLDNVKARDQAHSRYQESAELAYAGWTKQQQAVYDYSLGMHGKPQISAVPLIAKRVGITSDKVYKIKRQLAQELGSSL
jgi:DNA-directed RNA polymerase sigma subunit (sigma70/sigma32)